MNMFKVTLKLTHFYLHEVNMIIESSEDYSQIWANSTFQRNIFRTGTIFWLHMVSFMWVFFLSVFLLISCFGFFFCQPLDLKFLSSFTKYSTFTGMALKKSLI